MGRPGYLNLGHDEDLGLDRSPAALERRARELMDAAYERGIRYFDAARSYGRAEEFLGRWLRDNQPDDVVVGSKWGYVYTAGWQVDADPPEVKHHDVETLRRQLEETRANLGDALSLYQIHSATPDTGVLDDEEVLAELRRLRADGVAIGVTVSGASQPETIARALELDLFDAVQATWNLHERAAGDLLERASAAGLTVIVKEALANGRLTPRGANAALEAVAASAGTTSDALSLAAVLAQPWADRVLIGASSVPTLDANLATTTVAWDGSVEQRLQQLAEPSAQYWRTRSALPWN